MLYSLVGLVLALALAAAAWTRRARGGFYDREVYAMNSAAHTRYALIALAFAAFFAITAALQLDAAGIAGFALYAFFAVFYLTSFLRGAADPDE